MREESTENNLSLTCSYCLATWALRFYIQLVKEGKDSNYRTDNYLNSLLMATGHDITRVETSTTKRFINQLRIILKQVEVKTEYEKCVVNVNIEKLAKLIGLNSIEQKIIQLAAYIKNEYSFERLLEESRDLSDYQVLTYIACILDASYEDVLSSFSIKGRLLQSGLLVSNHYSGIGGLLELINGLSKQLFTPNIRKSEILDGYLNQAKATKLNISDYQYIHNIQLFIDYLTVCIDTKRQGVNILLYGVPGTGKTELSKVISAQLNCDLYEVSTEDNGRPLSGSERFASYRLSQYLSKNQRSMVLFDEIEDIFQVESSSRMQRVSLGKALINQTLETNPSPSIWISNNIHQLDQAYLRRFDLVHEIKIPPIEIRKKIIQGYFKNTPVSESMIDKLASHKNISPALVSQTANIAKLISTTKTDIEGDIESVFNQSLKAMGYKKIAKCKQSVNYQLDFINTKIDMSALVDLLREDSRARICLYGPPGTGKTAFATFISEKLYAPLLAKRASDLLGSYVGQTEANIAAAFEEATDNREVLLIDEADSFLQKRSKAQHSWQITQVNEFLTQMESYEGILFCTTNLMDDLDEAALRRFDLKIDLDYLSKEQAWQLFLQDLNEHERGDLTEKQLEKVRHELDEINNLTPGDFATIRRSNNLFKEQLTTEKLLQRLREEVSYKSVNKKSQGIGFMHDFSSEI